MKNNKAKKIAITGVWCGGKSLVIEFLSRKKRTAVFDADKEIRGYYNDRKSDVYKKIVQFFPQAVRKDGNIDRKKLGTLVFSDLHKLRLLEGIVHPVVISNLKLWMGKWGERKDFLFVEIPLLFEKKLQGMFDYVVFVYTNRRIQKERLLRKGFSEDDIKVRNKLYLPLKERMPKSDFIIRNTDDINHLKEMVDRLWRLLNRKIKRRSE